VDRSLEREAAGSAAGSVHRHFLRPSQRKRSAGACDFRATTSVHGVVWRSRGLGFAARVSLRGPQGLQVRFRCDRRYAAGPAGFSGCNLDIVGSAILRAFNEFDAYDPRRRMLRGARLLSIRGQVLRRSNTCWAGRIWNRN